MLLLYFYSKIIKIITQIKNCLRKLLAWKCIHNCVNSLSLIYLSHVMSNRSTWLVHLRQERYWILLKMHSIVKQSLTWRHLTIEGSKLLKLNYQDNRSRRRNKSNNCSGLLCTLAFKHLVSAACKQLCKVHGCAPNNECHNNYVYCLICWNGNTLVSAYAKNIQWEYKTSCVKRKNWNPNSIFFIDVECVS